MGARGSKSASELQVVTNIGTGKRPEPLEELTENQRKEWNRVVDRLPVDWFTDETHSMLAQYCKHHSAANVVGGLIEEMLELGGEGEHFDLDAFDQLLKMQERESRAMTALARSLRFTLQATYDPERRKGGSGKKPWDK